MKEELQLKLQAYLDGELPPGEAKSVTELIARDGDASALLTELTNTRNALAGFDDSIKLPESVEFHWSKIQREISRQPTPAPTPRLSLSASLRRFLVPAGAFAAVAIAALLTFPRTNGAGDAFTDATDSVAFTYHNYESGATLVWLDYPAENDFAEMDSDDTLEL